MSPVGFEPTLSAGEWPQTYALDRAATGTGSRHRIRKIKYISQTQLYLINGILRCYMFRFQRNLHQEINLFLHYILV